jgi:hypothetical protein
MKIMRTKSFLPDGDRLYLFVTGDKDGKVIFTDFGGAIDFALQNTVALNINESDRAFLDELMKKHGGIFLHDDCLCVRLEKDTIATRKDAIDRLRKVVIEFTAFIDAQYDY